MSKIKKIVLSMALVSALACSMNGLHISQQSSFNGGDTPSPAIPSVSVEVSID
ncbi:Phr family secreted Rap phosphatase inhibitor [Bacillus mycoides]|uniref:Phr family secreted Rap phosphatase inhibitor n=1 Tax=Bacillus mycoides TaxID=1405 RepID=A0A4V5TRX6_BACMY|nr:Phr family secreted Rap phosphatase inhibitor [Bacillus mycoides]TKI83923.1 Phr family secreted Rap phosphatase inhibitor [Bacillus mycoides]